MTAISESGVIDIVRRTVSTERENLRLGIGDDAAVFSIPGGYELVAATDTIVRGVHYPGGLCARDIGHRALAVNLSDLAAMGATPTWCLLNLSLPQAESDWVEAFAEGFAALAKRTGITLAGGDTVRGPEQVNVAAFGLVPAGTAVTRSGAAIGDDVWVTGTLGDAAHGLQMCADGNTDSPLANRFKHPEPRLTEGQRLRGIASAMIDISDGLKADLERLAVASGCGLEVDVDAIPVSALLRERAGVAGAVQLALAGGDDYELAFTMAGSDLATLTQRAAGFRVPVTRIGRVVESAGVRFMRAGDEIDTPMTYSHFDVSPG